MANYVNKKTLTALQKNLSPRRLRKAAEAIGADAVATIRRRTGEGRYIGGPRAKLRYSRQPLPAFYFGRGRFNKGALTTTREATVTFPANKLQWRGNMPYIIGGYKTYREARGLPTSKVDSRDTGAMLDSLGYKVESPTPQSYNITITVAPSQANKAYYTNLQRQWLGLNRLERAAISRRVREQFLSKPKK